MPRLAELPAAARLACLALVLLLALVPVLAAATGDAFLVRLFTRIVVFALAAAALDLVLGVAGLVSFGHAAFLGLGAYVVGIMFHHDFMGEPLLGLPPTQNLFAQILLAMLLGGLFALLTGLVVLRTRGVAFIMITLAFAQMLFFFFVSLKTYNGEDGIALWNRSGAGPIDSSSDAAFYYLCLASLAIFLVLAYRLHASRFGRVIRGAKDNERRMLALGYPVFRYRLVAYVLSGAFTALAGVLLANATYFVGPSFLAWPVSGELIVMGVIGGIGTVAGPALGAAVFLLLEEFVPTAMNALMPGSGEHWRIVLGPVLVAIAIYARTGLFGWLMGPGRVRPARPAAEATAHG